ncbi:large-conductance mechanosensitive channel protein MscL [Sporosarcina sp. FA9]|uniref:large-conductance mechanosensitive channel protein MscL n=1 Tax=Sporosarcina sp. FA9 TaxID=3413030 RepID=UPI003F65A5E5
MLKEFKEFALKGNVIDLAVAVVIGTAFGKIVASLVANIIMPLIGLITGGVDFTGLAYKYKETEILYGMFIQSVFDFFIIAIAIFFAIRLLMKFKRKEVPVEEVVVIDAQEALLTEIRDLLKQQNTR